MHCALDLIPAGEDPEAARLTEATFRRLVDADPEPLTSQFQVPGAKVRLCLIYGENCFPPNQIPFIKGEDNVKDPVE